MANENLRTLIDRLHETLNFVYVKDPSWKERGGWPEEEKGSILHRPAGELQLNAARGQTPVFWPPDYLEFLNDHNGWEHFWLDFTLVGIDGHHTQRANVEIAEYINEQTADLTHELGELNEVKIVEWEAADARNIFLSRHLPVAINFGGALLVYDTRTRTSKGDMDIVYWTIDFGVWEERRFHGLTGLFAWAQKEAEAYIKRRKLGKIPSKGNPPAHK